MPLKGRSVRATSQPIGAATAQQMTADDVARMKVVTSGSIERGLGEQPIEIGERERAIGVGQAVEQQP